MKANEVFEVLESMIKGIEPSPQEARLIEEMLDTIKRWELILEFYANKNYDNGLIARDALERLTEKDRKVWNVVKTQQAKPQPAGENTDA